jgi:hypothetical protein
MNNMFKLGFNETIRAYEAKEEETEAATGRAALGLSGAGAGIAGAAALTGTVPKVLAGLAGVVSGGYGIHKMLDAITKAKQLKEIAAGLGNEEMDNIIKRREVLHGPYVPQVNIDNYNLKKNAAFEIGFSDCIEKIAAKPPKGVTRSALSKLWHKIKGHKPGKLVGGAGSKVSLQRPGMYSAKWHSQIPKKPSVSSSRKITVDLAKAKKEEIARKLKATVNPGLREKMKMELHRLNKTMPTVKGGKIV